MNNKKNNKCYFFLFKNKYIRTAGKQNKKNGLISADNVIKVMPISIFLFFKINKYPKEININPRL